MKIFDNLARTFEENEGPIFIGLGLVAGIGCVATAIAKTRKLDDVLEENKKAIEALKERKAEIEKKIEGLRSEDVNVTEENEIQNTVVSLQKEERKDAALTTVKNVGRVSKLYFLPGTLGLLSMFFVLRGAGVLINDKAEATALAASLFNEFKDYRKRWVKKVGEEEEYRVYHDVKPSDKPDTEVLAPDGETHTPEKRYESNGNGTPTNKFQFFYGEDYNRMCNGDHYRDYVRVMTVWNEAQSDLVRDLKVCAEDILKRLGYDEDHNPEIDWNLMHNSFWLYYPDGDNPHGDNFISFGFVNSQDETFRRYVNNREDVLLIELNVDGIYNAKEAYEHVRKNRH